MPAALPRHHISEIDAETRTGICSVCGPNTPLVANNHRLYCAIKRRETKANSRRNAPPEVQERRLQSMREWNIKNRDRRRKENLLKQYDITVEEYDTLLTKQGGTCALCLGPPRGPGKKNGIFHVDHCHETGRVRGLLCGGCNGALGWFSDDVERLRRAITYLQCRHAETPVSVTYTGVSQPSRR